MTDIEAIRKRQEERKKYADLAQTDIGHEELTPQTIADIDALLAEIEELRSDLNGSWPRD